MKAVAKGGVIRFRCGAKPVRIEMQETAKVVNTSRRVVLDGRGRVTLSGGGERRILYQNTCDPAQTWTTSHCDDQARPRLVVQNLTLADGDATGETYDGGGGGAIFARGGRLKIVGSTFLRNRCDPTGPDLGGGAVRALSQHRGRPVLVALLGEQGVRIDAPFMTLSFLALSVIPELKLTDHGLVDVLRARVVGLAV